MRMIQIIVNSEANLRTSIYNIIKIHYRSRTFHFTKLIKVASEGLIHDMKSIIVSCNRVR